MKPPAPRHCCGAGGSSAGPGLSARLRLRRHLGHRAPGGSRRAARDGRGLATVAPRSASHAPEGVAPPGSLQGAATLRPARGAALVARRRRRSSAASSGSNNDMGVVARERPEGHLDYRLRTGVGRRASGVGRRASGVGRSGTGDGWPGKQQGATGLHRGCSTERGLERPVGRAIRLPSAGPRCDGYTRWSGSIAHRAPGPGQPPRSAGPSNGGQRECLRPAGLFSRASSPHASRRHTPSCPSRQTSTRRPRSPRRASRVSPSRPACPGTSPTPRQPGPRR